MKSYTKINALSMVKNLKLYNITNNNMKKYYRVIKDNFLWNKWTIIVNETGYKWYEPMSDFMKRSEFDTTEYISKQIIEDKINTDFFERVYTDDITWKIFKTKDEMIKLYENMLTK